MGNYFDDLPIGRIVLSSGATIGTSGGQTGVSIAQKQSGPSIRTRFTLSNHPQAVTNGVEYQSSKLWTFPEGKFIVFGVVCSLAETTTSEIATTLNSGVTGAFALGSAAASSTTLNNTMADYLASSAFVTSSTIDVAAATFTPNVDNTAGATVTIIDGASAKSIYLNTAFASTGDVDGNATMTLSGIIDVYWYYLGGNFSVIDV